MGFPSTTRSARLRSPTGGWMTGWRHALPPREPLSEMLAMSWALPPFSCAARGQLHRTCRCLPAGTHGVACFPSPARLIQRLQTAQFFAERRLRHQLRLAGRPELSEMGNRLADNLGRFFDGVEARSPWLQATGKHCSLQCTYISHQISCRQNSSVTFDCHRFAPDPIITCVPATAPSPHPHTPDALHIDRPQVR